MLNDDGYGSATLSRTMVSDSDSDLRIFWFRSCFDNRWSSINRWNDDVGYGKNGSDSRYIGSESKGTSLLSATI